MDNIQELLDNYSGDVTPGGVGDDFNIDLIPLTELEEGISIEMEHTDDPIKSLDTVKDHEKETVELTGKPEYYEEYLIPMEEQMKEDGKDTKDKSEAAMNHMFLNSKTAIIKVAANSITDEEIELEHYAKAIGQFGNILSYSIDLKGPAKHITFKLAEDKDEFTQDREVEDEFERTDKDETIDAIG